MMKKFIKTKLTVLFLLFFLLTSYPTQAASGSILVESTTSQSGNQITVNVYMDSTASYNAVEFELDYGNLEYISSTTNTSLWTAITGPSESDGLLTYAGAKLGEPITGKNLVLTAIFAPTSSAPALLSVSGEMAIIGSEGDTEASETVLFANDYIVSGNQVLPNTNLTNDASALFGISLMIIAAAILRWPLLKDI